MKILLFGANGQLGWELQRSLAALGEVWAMQSDAAKNPQGLEANFADPDGLARTVRAVRPNVIVNAAAWTAVDKAEAEPALARTVNAQAPARLSDEAASLGAWIIHYSTDYVFDGSGERPWTEADTAAPLSVYGQTKWEGEQAVARNPRHLILRTSWVYAARGNNFAKTMLRLAKERETLSVINDQVGAPTGAELLADVSAHAIRALQHDPGLAGLYHCAAAGETSWFGYAKFVLERAQALGQVLRVHPDQLQFTTTANYPTAARRPLNSRLDCSRLEQSLGLRLPPWQTGVARMLDEIALHSPTH